MSTESQSGLFDHTSDLASQGEFSEANLCLCWVTRSDGRHWRDWWASRMPYERDFMLKLYREERARADLYNNGRMTPFDLVWGMIDEAARWEEKLIDKWAAEIRAAAMALKPCPFVDPDELEREGRHVSPYYRHRLAVAIMRSGIVVIRDPAPQPEQPKRRRKAAA